MTSVRVRILPGGLERARDEIVAPWLVEVLEKARTVAVRLVNVDTANLRSSIGTRIERTSTGGLSGILEATANYALWQETEPGDPIPGVGTRVRAGGKPYLRPGLTEALRPYTR